MTRSIWYWLVHVHVKSCALQQITKQIKSLEQTAEISLDYFGMVSELLVPLTKILQAHVIQKGRVIQKKATFQMLLK